MVMASLHQHLDRPTAVRIVPVLVLSRHPDLAVTSRHPVAFRPIPMAVVVIIVMGTNAQADAESCADSPSDPSPEGL